MTEDTTLSRHWRGILVICALTVAIVSMVYWVETTQPMKPYAIALENSVQFTIVPHSAIGMKLRYDTKPGVIAFKLNTTGKVRVHLGKIVDKNFVTIDKVEELEIQKMDVVKFLCDACGATNFIVQSLEGKDDVVGEMVQLR